MLAGTAGMQEEPPLQAEKYFYAKDEKSQLLLIIFIRIRALCQGGIWMKFLSFWREDPASVP